METIEEEKTHRGVSPPRDDRSTEGSFKGVRLTKSGKPDGRSISSKKNLEKGKKKVMDILQKAKKSSKQVEEEETDDEEFEIVSAQRKEPTILLSSRGGETPLPSKREVEGVADPYKEPHKPVIEGRVVGVADPYTTPSNQFYIDEIELTKKELQEFKKQVQENNLREERRKQLEIQKQVDKIRTEAYGRLNSLSQNMSMKF